MARTKQSTKKESAPKLPVKSKPRKPPVRIMSSPAWVTATLETDVFFAGAQGSRHKEGRWAPAGARRRDGQPAA